MASEKINKKTAEEGENIKHKKQAASKPATKDAKKSTEKNTTKMNKDVDQE